MARSKTAWTIAGAFIGAGLIAWLASMAAGRLAERALAIPEGGVLAAIGEIVPSATSAAPRPGHGGDKPLRRPSKRGYIDPIVSRNIFDSTAVGAVAVDDGQGDSDRKTDLKVILLATVVALPETYSSALIAEEKGKDGAIGYGIGDELLGEATIYKIEARRVVIKRDDGTLEYLAMEEGQAFVKEGASKSKGGSSDEDDNGVTKEGNNKFIVDQAVVDAALANPEKLYSQIRAVPHKDENGDIDGYRLSGIRRKSLFRSLGVKNGDVVHAVNGTPLTSMSGALSAFNSLQDDKNFTFDLTRRNKRTTFEYEIR